MTLNKQHELRESGMNTKSIYVSSDSQQKIIALNHALLDRWPVPCDKLNIPTRYGNTFVIASGHVGAPALVLLHGSGSNAVSWIGDIAAYSRSFRTYCVDILGEAGKSSPNRLPWNGPSHGEWMEDVLNALGVRKTSFLGLSLGGWIALKAATYGPQRLEKLVLLAPGGIAPARASFLLKAFLLSMMGPKAANGITRSVFGRQAVNEDAMRFFKTIMANFRPRTDEQPMFTDKELERLSMPVLLVVGALDAVLPSRKIVERMRKHTAILHTRVLPDAGHALTGLAPMVTPFLTAR